MDGTIKFNVRQRGRAHRGQDRNFDTRALAAIINSPETQERVRNRDMLGYYGHWQRMRFGLIPPETAIVGGNSINIEPAIVTTYLKADEDGNIEHRTEFLDTAAGKIAERLHKSRTGGFSSAIDAVPRGGKDVARVFAGFDYVLEPNFTSNRGYTFDGVMEPGAEGLIFDFVMHDFNQSNAAMAALYDSVQRDHMLALATIERLMEDNEELTSMIARGAGGNVVLDAAGSRPTLLPKAGANAFASRVASFKGAELAMFDKLPSDPSNDTDSMLDRAREHYGIPK